MKNMKERFHKLIFQTSKFSYFLVIVLVLPILFTIDEILDIWLKEVPEYTAIFCRLILVYLSIYKGRDFANNKCNSCCLTCSDVVVLYNSRILEESDNLRECDFCTNNI